MVPLQKQFEKEHQMSQNNLKNWKYYKKYKTSKRRAFRTANIKKSKKTQSKISSNTKMSKNLMRIRNNLREKAPIVIQLQNSKKLFRLEKL